MNLLKLLGVGAAMTLLSACSGNDFSGPYDVEALRGMGTSSAGDAFTQGLTVEYRSFALNLYDFDKDWGNSYLFAGKGLAAGRGEAVAAEQPSNWVHLNADQIATLNGARGKLTSVLDGGAKTAKPALAAKAQVAYDCWVKNEDDGWLGGQTAWQKQDIAACKGLFNALMAELTVAPKPAAPVAPPATIAAEENFFVYFDWDSAKLDAEANRQIDKAAAAANKNQAARITLVGHADLSGTPDYNLRLSLRRADAVRQALIARGIPGTRQSVTGVGDSEPAIPTARGVKERRNRFVSIGIK